ncbi:MAG: hypothetical protein GKS00_11065 [Alphaproteobacteria bacterium]|nr:hypothetical protein [Alphaproteobacteria bacterium]
MRIFTIVAVAALVALNTPAFAQKVTSPPLGQRFISLCKSPNNASKEACGGVVIALMNAHVEMARQNPNQRVICPPRKLTIEEGRRVFLQWAEKIDSARVLRFPHLVMTSLTSRYPCSQFIIPK